MASRNASDAVLANASEIELAQWRRAEGRRVLHRRGRWWVEMRRGFFHSIHWMARHCQREAKCPTPLLWGFRTTLADDDVDTANGALPVHLLSDLDNYDIGVLPPRRRTQLRKCKKRVEIVQVTDPALLRDQGYEVRRASAERLKLWMPPPKNDYLADLEAYVVNPFRMVLAGVTGSGELAGYMDGYAADGTAYIERVYLNAEGLAADLGTGFTFEFVEICKRSAGIREIVHGLHVPSNTGLCRFKEAMGFAVVRVPTRYWLLRPAGAWIRRRTPEVYYRLTGHGPFADDDDMNMATPAHSLSSKERPAGAVAEGGT